MISLLIVFMQLVYVQKINYMYFLKYDVLVNKHIEMIRCNGIYHRLIYAIRGSGLMVRHES